MSNLEEQLLEYFSNPEAADLNTVLRATIAEVRSLRTQLEDATDKNVELADTIKSFTETIRRKNEQIKRLEKRTVDSLVEEESDEAIEAIEQFSEVVAEIAGVTHPANNTQKMYRKGGRPRDEAKKRGVHTSDGGFRHAIIR